MSDQPSFRTIHDVPQPDACVYWLTHAGGGTNTLAHRMRTSDSQLNVRVRSPWMPKREELVDKEFLGDIHDLARLLGDQIIADREHETQPLLIVGHSFGSLLAYRIARYLVDRRISVDRLIALSFPTPDVLTHEQQLHQLDDEQLIEQVDRLFGGVPEEIREDADAQKFFVPGLRFDLGLLERYQHSKSESPLPIPIMAICGTDDRAVDMAQMIRWKQFTDRQFRLRAMPGDHFFPLQRMPEIYRAALS